VTKAAEVELRSGRVDTPAFRVSIGRAVYLRLNSTAYSVISMNATDPDVLIPQSLVIGAYDGGRD